MSKNDFVSCSTMNKILVLAVVMVASFCEIGQCQREVTFPDWYCGDSFCADKYLANPCPEAKKCENQGNRKYITPEECNCCPGSFCFNYLKEDSVCELASSGEPSLCGPYQTCSYNESTVSYKCLTITDTACMAERKIYNDRYESGSAGTAESQPECTAGGQFAIKQCLPGSICFCATRQGERIFGLSLPAEISNCHCAKDIEFLQSINFTGTYPRCLPNGDYDALQCIGRSCFCLLNPSDRKPLDKIQELSCWKKNTVDSKEINPSKHLRLCEYKRAVLEADALIARRNGTIILQADHPECDYDGNFSPVQLRNNKYVCVDPQGNQIEGFESPVGKQKPDCNCARIRYLMRDIVNGRPICCSRGSFRKWQCSGSLCYCVDADGKQRIDAYPIEVNGDKLEDLPCFNDGDECVESNLSL